jgi:hypothetical protein
MPQFDFYTFITQTFWILSSFFYFYFFFLIKFIVKYSSVLKFREKLKTQINLQKTSSLKIYDTFISFFFKK